jgi:hypothetical protein
MLASGQAGAAGGGGGALRRARALGAEWRRAARRWALGGGQRAAVGAEAPPAGRALDRPRLCALSPCAFMSQRPRRRHAVRGGWV